MKAAPFECGKDPIEVAEGRFAIKFSTIAIFFILIDIELLFIWPWAMLYRQLGWFGFVEMLVFLGILMLGFALHLAEGGPRMGVGSFFTSKLDEAIGWARKYSIFQYPFVTACCGMEYMATACSHYDIDRFGAGLPRFSPRQADVLFVVGTISHKMAPVLKRIYDQMTEPKWVVAFGVCTCTGGFYDNYATVQGIDTIIPVDVYIPGCPPRPESVIDGLMKLQDKIAVAGAEVLSDGAAILDELRARFGDAIVETHEHRGDLTAVVARDAPARGAAHCRDEPALGVRRAHGPHGGRLLEVSRPRGRPALRGRLPPLLDRPQPPRSG